jgi:Cofilin/tropomyosin-type actin-binding protein
MKLGHTYKYLVMKISDNNEEIEVEHEGGADAKYEDFTALLPDDDGRYAIYDFEFETDDGGKRNKLVFVLWYVCSERKYFVLSPSPLLLTFLSLSGLRTPPRSSRRCCTPAPRLT